MVLITATVNCTVTMFNGKGLAKLTKLFNPTAA